MCSRRRVVWLAFAGTWLGDRPACFAGEAPAMIAPDALSGLSEIAAGRRRIVETALEIGRSFRLDRYLFGSADPKRGGFDCSGAVYYMLRRCGFDPPRTSAAQFEWVKNAGTFVPVPRGTNSLDDPVFDKLKPGDLLFWSGTYRAAEGRPNKITHVQVYLGREKSDGRHVMIGSTDGRSYRGVPRTGYGVYDFRLPRPTSKGKFVGFGAPPGEPDDGSG